MRLPSGSILAQYLKRNGVAGHGIECELRSVRRGFRVPQSVVGAPGMNGSCGKFILGSMSGTVRVLLS